MAFPRPAAPCFRPRRGARPHRGRRSCRRTEVRRSSNRVRTPPARRIRRSRSCADGEVSVEAEGRADREDGVRQSVAGDVAELHLHASEFVERGPDRMDRRRKVGEPLCAYAALEQNRPATADPDVRMAVVAGGKVGHGRSPGSTPSYIRERKPHSARLSAWTLRQSRNSTVRRDFSGGGSPPALPRRPSRRFSATLLPRRGRRRACGDAVT